MRNENPGLASVKDPKGNKIIIPEDSLHWKKGPYSYFINETLTTPTYMIDIAQVGIYFFKLINWQINFMVQTRCEGNNFIVEECVENPSEEFVSNLLKRGTITSFV